MRVLLTEGSGLTSRQAAGRLRAAGHHVGVLSSDPIFLARFTNATAAWHRVPAFGPDPFVWLDAALGVVHDQHYDVLLPTQEQVTVLAASADRVAAAGGATVVPPFAALRAVQDKVAASATLDHLGLPQPPTTVLADASAVAAFDRFPVFLKAPIGTASGGVGLVGDRTERDALLEGWDLDDAFALGGVVAQAPAPGPLAMVQSVFDHGRLVAFHANRRVREGALGGASHKRSLDLPEVRAHFETLGGELAWHGALGGDVILTPSGPVIIDVNPRLIEPNNAWHAGVDLVGAMLDLAEGDHPDARPPSQPDVDTHQLLLAVLGAAQHGRGRRGVAAEIGAAVTSRGSYRDSVEELTPVAGDPRAAVPLALAAAVTLVRPAGWTWFSSGSVSNYAVTAAGWRQICRYADRSAADRPARRPNHMPSPSEMPLA